MNYAGLAMTVPTSAPPASDATAPLPQERRSLSAIAVFGEVLIALGVLLALFVAWQLFYTDILAERDQQGALDELSWADPNVVGGITADGGSDLEVPEQLAIIPEEFRYYDTEPPVMASPGYAETFGALYVPRWGRDYVRPISEGVTRRDVLDPLGIGHYPDTVMPGGWGNFSIAGHRTTYGKPFSDVDQFQVGDAVIVQTEEAWYVYKVTEWSIVQPQQTEVIAPVPGQPDAEPNGRYITLTTCHPRYSAAQRWIVHGELEYWAPTGYGYPPEAVEELT